MPATTTKKKEFFYFFLFCFFFVLSPHPRGLQTASVGEGGGEGGGRGGRGEGKRGEVWNECVHADAPCPGGPNLSARTRVFYP
jgi:hypothetical protein